MHPRTAEDTAIPTEQMEKNHYVTAITNLLELIHIQKQKNYNESKTYKDTDKERQSRLEKIKNEFDQLVVTLNQINRLKELLDEFHQFYLELFNEFFNAKINTLIEQLHLTVELKTETISTVSKIRDEVDLESAQNLLFELKSAVYANDQLTMPQESNSTNTEKLNEIQYTQTCFSKQQFNHTPNIFKLIKERIAKFIHFITNQIENDKQQLTSLREHATRSIIKLQEFPEIKENNATLLRNQLATKQTAEELISFIDELRKTREDAQYLKDITGKTTRSKITIYPQNGHTPTHFGPAPTTGSINFTEEVFGCG